MIVSQCRRSFHLAEIEVSCSWGRQPITAALVLLSCVCGAGVAFHPGLPALCLTALRVGRAWEVGGQGFVP